MGYNFHITRARNWFEAESHPISLDEWLEFAGSSPLLTSGGSMENPYFELVGDSGQATWLHWSDGQVSAGGSGADTSIMRSIFHIASQLGASVQGDDYGVLSPPSAD